MLLTFYLKSTAILCAAYIIGPLSFSYALWDKNSESTVAVKGFLETSGCIL